MKQIDMKMSKKQTKDAYQLAAGNTPSYPWGLEITLEEEAIKKLGIDASKLGINDKLSIMATATVNRINSNKNQDGKEHRTIGLQIVKMAKPTKAGRMEAGADMLKEMRK